MYSCKILPLNYLQKKPAVPQICAVTEHCIRHYISTSLSNTPLHTLRDKILIGKKMREKDAAKLALRAKWDNLSKDTPSAHSKKEAIHIPVLKVDKIRWEGIWLILLILFLYMLYSRHNYKQLFILFFPKNTPMISRRASLGFRLTPWNTKGWIDVVYHKYCDLMQIVEVLTQHRNKENTTSKLSYY